MNAHTPCDIRHDGWTGERQRAFLESVAVGATVEEACRHVGMSVSSAYALRRRAAGSAFALGWQAASLLARDSIADALTARAIDGQVDTYSRPDGSTWTRHRFDNRLASTMLARLDRQADDAAGTPSQGAARLIASGWDAWLAGMAADDSPAAAGLFLQRRGLAGEGPASGNGAQDERDLAPLLALAAADRWLRVGADIAREVDMTDLDPAARADWTAEQWARAEAAGLLHFAAPARDVEDDASTPPLPPLRTAAQAMNDDALHVWQHTRTGLFLTDFPPPPGAEDVLEFGRWGDAKYERQLTDEEGALMDQAYRLYRMADGELVDPEQAEAARLAYFDAVRADIAALREGTTPPPGGLNAASSSSERQDDGPPHSGELRRDEDARPQGSQPQGECDGLDGQAPRRSPFALA